MATNSKTALGYRITLMQAMWHHLYQSQFHSASGVSYKFASCFQNINSRLSSRISQRNKYPPAKPGLYSVSPLKGQVVWPSEGGCRYRPNLSWS